MDFSKRLQSLRKERGITQQELGLVINVNDRTVGAWERGLAKPGAGIIIQIADYFNVTTDYLLGRDTSDISSDESFQSLQRCYEALPPLEKQRMIEMYSLMFGEAFKNKDQAGDADGE